MATADNHQAEVELAYQILFQTGQPVYFRDLIQRILDKKSLRVFSQAQAMAEIHTQINMDSRFFYCGKGMWGLSEWSSARGSRGDGDHSVNLAHDEAAAADGEDVSDE